jgi:hypothetical protein
MQTNTNKVSDLDVLYHGIFVSAIESGGYGIVYWCAVKHYKISESEVTKADWTNYKAVIEVTEFDDNETDPRLVDRGVNGNIGRYYTITRATIAKGVRAISAGKIKGVHQRYSERFVAALRMPLDADLDASDADLAVQAGLFGEVIFG